MWLGSGLVVVSLLGAEPTAATAPAPAEVIKTYEEERARAGNDADAHVRLALWCEANGLKAERLRHLALAVLHKPSHPLARGLMGLVAYRGQWQRPEAVVEKLQSDPDRAGAVADYLQKRARTPDTARDQWELALWCEQHGLKAESVAHLRAVVRHDPSREAAWKRLGFKKHNGQWVDETKLAAARDDAALQKQADRHWKTRLESYRRYRESADPSRREAAEDALALVNDPRAVPSVWAVFAARGDDDRQSVAVQLLGQIDARGASRALAILAVSGQSAEVRRTAAETLKRRDPREFADLLIALIREPIKYEVTAVGGQGTPGVLSIHGKQADVKRLYTPPPVAFPLILPTDQIGFDESGMPVITRRVVNRDRVNVSPQSSTALYVTPSVASPEFSRAFPAFIASHGGHEPGRAAATTALHNAAQARPGRVAVNSGTPPGRYTVTSAAEYQIPVGQIMAEAQMASAAAEQKLESDLASIEAQNQKVGEANARVLPVLAAVAGHDYGPDPEAWTKWWNDQIGFARQSQKVSQEKPTVVEQVPIDYQPPPVQPVLVNVQVLNVQRSTSCFGAGTAVKTLDGARPIEAIKAGDLVLSQSTRTGALGFHPVIAAYHNPPNPTYRIEIGGEAVVSSFFHRFWKAGQGWVMARDLKVGDALRTLDGLAKVSAIKEDETQPTYNLEVADDADFFVGRLGTLVHDITLPDLRVTPFDAPPEGRAE